MKMLKGKNLMNLILGALLVLPFCAILGRVIYTQSNKNAYQSYSEVSSMTTTEITANTQSISGNNYMINLLDTGTGYSENIYINSSTIDYEYIAGTTITYEVKAIRFYPNNTYFRLVDGNNLSHNYELSDAQRTYLNGQTFNWNHGNLVEPNQSVRFFMITYSGGKLDNAFEYSLDQFVKDNNFGRLDLTSWFTGMFLNDNATNNLYVHFANWYLNYAMLITLMHFLFLVLMWFVNYSRRLLERGMNYDW